MQPYFLPYIGYFQMINAVDKFVIYDNIEYTKKGWINRNRILVNGLDVFITLNLKKSSDFDFIGEKEISDVFYSKEKDRILSKIKQAYRKAPYYKQSIEIIQTVLNNSERNLFHFLKDSLYLLVNYLEIKTEFIISSSLEIDHSLKKEDKVIAICKNLYADTYINPIGGKELYSNQGFSKNTIDILFIETEKRVYRQFTDNFIPNLSIVDVMMFNSVETIKEYLNKYTLT